METQWSLWEISYETGKVRFLQSLYKEGFKPEHKISNYVSFCRQENTEELKKKGIKISETFSLLEKSFLLDSSSISTLIRRTLPVLVHPISKKEPEEQQQQAKSKEPSSYQESF
jgi:hypothetical protein